MQDDKQGWKRFRKLRFDSKTIAKKTKKAESATVKHAHRFVVKKLTNLQLVRQYIALWLIIMGSLIGATLLQTYWTERAYHQVAAVSGGTYAEAIKGKIETLNPLYARTQAELSAQKLLFSSLFDYDEAGRLRNDLATNIMVGKNSNHFIVTLRGDAVWSDGKPVTADDVVFTVNMMKSAEANSIMREGWTGVTAKALDSHTVDFKLKTSYAPFADALTFAVLPKHVLKDVSPSNMRENSFSISPVGSGPMSFRLLQPVGKSGDERAHKIIYMVANEKYYRGAPKLQRFELHAYETQEGMLSAAKLRDVNALVDLQRSQQGEVSSLFTTKEYPINSGVYVFFNNNSPALRDKDVRKALRTGTDIEKLRLALNPNAPALYTPFIPNQLDAKMRVSKHTKNTAAAKKALTKAGWKLSKNAQVRKNKKQELRIKLVANKEAEYEPVLEELKKQWSALGVAVDVVEFEEQPAGENFAQAILQRRDYDVLINELTFGSDPDVFAYWHSSQALGTGLNFSNYESEIADDILTSARVRKDKQLRDEKYKTFARQWYADAPALPIAQSTMSYTRAKQVEALQENTVLPMLSNRYSNILYWSAERAPVYKTP